MPVPEDLAELAVRQLTETVVCMKPGMLEGLEMISRLFLGSSVIFKS